MMTKTNGEQLVPQIRLVLEKKRSLVFLFSICFGKGISMTGKRKLFFVGLALLTVGALVSCQSTATSTLPVLSQAGIRVEISDDSCPNVIVYVGQEISWTNQGKQEHIVRAKSTQGERAFDSGTLKPGESFAITLTQPDVYEYECSADGSLTGSITLEP